jgi:hypothetical protein
MSLEKETLSQYCITHLPDIQGKKQQLDPSPYSTKTNHGKHEHLVFTKSSLPSAACDSWSFSEYRNSSQGLDEVEYYN